MITVLNTRFLSPIQDKGTRLVMGLFFLNCIVKALPIFRGIMIHPDAPVYLWSAQALDAGNVQGAISAYPMLFYPFLIMLVHKLGIDWLWAGRLISVTASCFALLPFMAIAKRFSAGWPFIVVSLLFIFLPEYNYRGYAVLRDPLYLSLTLCCLYYALRFLEEKSLTTFFFVIFISSLLPLLRVEGAVTTLLVDTWCFFVLLCSAEKYKKFIGVFLFMGAAALLYYLYSKGSFSSLVRLESFTYFLNKLSSGQLSVQSCLKALDDMYHTLPFATNGSNFWQVIQRHWPWIYFIGMLYVFVKILGWPTLILSVAGFIHVFKERDARKIFLLSVFVGQTLFMMLFYLFRGYLEVRYMLLPAILLLFCTLFSLASVFDAFCEKIERYFSFKRNYLLIVFSCFLVLPFGYDTLFHRYRIHIPLLEESCLSIKNEILTEEGQRWFVVGNARRMAWFLDLEDMPYKKKISYDEIEKRFLKKTSSPALFVLLLNKRVPDDVELIDTISRKYPLASKVFVGPKKDKHIVIAVWNGAESLNSGK